MRACIRVQEISESKMGAVLLGMLRQWFRMRGLARSQGGCLLVVVKAGENQMNSIQNTAPGMTEFNRGYNKRTQVTMRGRKCYELGEKIRSTTVPSGSGSGQMAVEEVGLD